MNPAESDEVTDLTGNPFERLKKTIVLRNNHSFLGFPLHSFFNLHPDLFVFDVFQEFAAESQGGSPVINSDNESSFHYHCHVLVFLKRKNKKSIILENQPLIPRKLSLNLKINLT